MNIFPQDSLTDTHSRRLFIVFIVLLAIFSSISVFTRQHVVDGDAISYVDAMHVLEGASMDSSLVGQVSIAKYALLTTSLGLEIIIFLSLIFGKITTAWLVWDTIAYLSLNIIFYKLILMIFKRSKTAFVGALFFAANYGLVIFGLTYFMDMGGWLFYGLSIYFLYSYVESSTKRDLYLAALSISVGALMKESAPFACIPLFFVILYENRHSFSSFVKKIVPPSLIAIVPMLIQHLNMFIVFDYSYWQFVLLNHTIYHYKSKTAEYIKTFGSLLNFFAPVALAGLFVILKSGRDRLREEFGMNDKKLVFIASVLISSLPAVLWPGITQRVLFMVVPGLVMISCFFVKRYEKYWYLSLALIAIYIVCSFNMDTILEVVN
ncbi:MAG: glycosyltransferase family 39 protein [Candidatus Taylorbacteria bacterium]|nr:glycosyltransferase family 39 protein [Candidatus Taylorbacteria bacterium]